MTAPIGILAASAQPTSGTLPAWKALRESADIQFVPVADPPVKPPPEWLQAIGRVLGKVFGWLGELLAAILAPFARLTGLSARTVETGLIVLALLVLGWLAWRIVAPRWRAWRNAPRIEAPEWSPPREAALALLEEADRLAAEGRFAEATRLLLQRSLGEIAAARPELLLPSSTAREIGADPRLPRRAAEAFAVIAREVERGTFALARLARADWQRARDAYAGFALVDPA